jgi:hypothetical protein
MIDVFSLLRSACADRVAPGLEDTRLCERAASVHTRRAIARSGISAEGMDAVVSVETARADRDLPEIGLAAARVDTN